jgi:hypothetical protein
MIMQKKARASLALVGLLAILATGCGGGRGGTADVAATSSTTSAVASSVPQFGDLESPCGPGSPSGSPDQAVTGSSITIGYGDDASYAAAPGQGHEGTDAVKALIKWCNEQGGINGREVVGNYYDAKITEVMNVMTEACKQTFMLVGQFFALPGAAEQTRIECGLPTVPGFIPAADLANAPLMVSPYPQPIQEYNVAGPALLAQAFPDKVKRTGTMTPDFPAAIDNMQKFRGSVTAVGFEFLQCAQTYPITGVADYRPYLQFMKDCGAEVVYTPTVGVGLQNMLDAADSIDYHPLWIPATTAFTHEMAGWNKLGLGNEVYVQNGFVPITYTPEGSANATYVELVTANGGDVSLTGQIAASAFLLWATAAKACGDGLTRSCVMQELQKIDSWTAGGLSSEQHPASNTVNDCQLVMKLDGPAWVQWQPAEEGQFRCDPSYAVTVDPAPDSMAGLKLDPKMVAQKNTVG